MKIYVTCFLICFLFFPAFSSIDSLIQLTKTKQDTNAVLAGYELGKALVGRNIDSSYMFLVQAAYLADSLDYTYGKLVTYRSIGSVAPRMGKYEESLAWLNKGLRLIDSLNLPIKNKVDFLTNTGVAHYRMGFLGLAIEPYIEAVQICHDHGFDDQRSRLLNNLGIFYRNLERYEEAIGIYQQSYELREEADDTLGMGNLLFNMASAYSKLSDHENALETLKQAEEIYRNAESEAYVIHTLIARGNIYVEIKDYDKAYDEYMLASKFPYEQLEVPFNFDLYLGLAYVKSLKGENTQAEMHLNKIADDVIASDLAEQKMRYYKFRANLLSKRNAFKPAFENLSSLQELQHQIAENDKATFRQEMETKYLTSEKEHEIELLNSENQLTVIKLKNARNRNIGFGIGLIGFTSFIIWLLLLYQKTMKQKEEISIANKDKEVLLKEIHHRVKNNLQVVSSLLTLQSKYVEDENALAAINTGKTRVESMSILHRNLYQKDNLKNISVKKYFEDLIDNLIETYQLNDKNIQITKDVEELELDIDTVMPLGLITNELVSNALKYAFTEKTEGVITLSLKKRDGKIFLSVSDDGAGIPFTEIPTKSETLGMQLIKSFTRKLEAKINIDNSKGTKIEIEIPFYKLAV